MNNFIHFKDILVEQPETWKGKKVLSLDIDWASDEMLNYTIDLIESKGIKATFFVTHDTTVLERLRENPLFELGIHPNFNPLLDGNKNAKSVNRVLDELLEIVPAAKTLRSHSMTTSGKWLGLFKQKGITHLSNYLQFGLEPVVPFRQINGLTEVPVYFADDGLIFLNDSKDLECPKLSSLLCANFDGLKVFNFHPVHIYINSKSFRDYERFKIDGVKPSLVRLQESEGIRNVFKRLLN